MPTGQNFFDVTRYGARGDGSTDDSAAIQATINAAEAYVANLLSQHTFNQYFRGYGWVYFPGGSYVVTQALNVNSGHVGVIGDGGVNGASTIVCPQDIGNVLHFQDPQGPQNTGGQRVTSLAFLATTQITSGSALYLELVNYARLEDVWCHGFFNGITLDSVNILEGRSIKLTHESELGAYRGGSSFLHLLSSHNRPNSDVWFDQFTFAGTNNSTLYIDNAIFLEACDEFKLGQGEIASVQNSGIFVLAGNNLPVNGLTISDGCRLDDNMNYGLNVTGATSAGMGLWNCTMKCFGHARNHLFLDSPSLSQASFQIIGESTGEHGVKINKGQYITLRANLVAIGLSATSDQVFDGIQIGTDAVNVVVEAPNINVSAPYSLRYGINCQSTNANVISSGVVTPGAGAIAAAHSVVTGGAGSNVRSSLTRFDGGTVIYDT